MSDHEHLDDDGLRKSRRMPRFITGDGATDTIDLDGPFPNEPPAGAEFDQRAGQEAVFGKLLKSLPIPALLVDQTGTIVYAVHSYGKLREAYRALRGQPFTSLFPRDEDQTTARGLIQRVFSERKPVVWESLLVVARRKIWGRMYLRTILMGEEKLVLLLVEDLTLKKRQILLNKRHTDQLGKAQEELEQRVRDRTAELSEANESLLREVEQRKDAERALQKSKETIEAILNATSDHLFLVDSRGKILALNRPFADRLDKKISEIVGQKIADVLPAKVAFLARPLFDRVFLTGKELRFEFAHNGRYYHNSLYPVRPATGDVEAVAVFSRDITRRKRTEEKLSLSAKIIESSNEAILVTDVGGNIVEVNDAFCELTGYSREEVLGQNPRIMKSGKHSRSFYEEMWQSLRDTGSWRGEVWDRRKNGEVFPKLIAISAVRNHEDAITHYVGIFSDITRIKQTERRLQHLAHFDALTHLPNRLLFRERLRLSLAESSRNRKMAGLIILDLDRFKDINDTLGHQAGDQLLVAVAHRLTESLRGSDTVARLGGDEFAIILPQLGRAGDAAGIAGKVIDALTQPFPLKSREVIITASMGITVFPDDGSSVDRLLQNADLALYHAKGKGKNTYRFFSGGMNREVQERLELEQDLRKAMERQEFEVFYQPKLDFRTGTISGAEALIRWRHPTRGLVSPGAFIPVAEETGMILPIGEWVLRTACKQTRDWIDMGHGPLSIAVNVSASQLERQDLVVTVERALADSGLPPESLELELTESVAMKDPDTTITFFQQLKQLGIYLSIDDFGTGYSSLSYLRRFPLDRLKVDKSFVEDSTSNQDQGSIVRAIIALAHSLKLTVVAEGVETEEQLRFLELHGCDQWQGFYFSPPVPQDQFLELLKNRRMRQGG